MLFQLLASGIRLLLLVAAASAVAGVAFATDAGAVTPRCPSFGSQADAQDYFVEAGGGPRQRVGSLDQDRDGVACEERPGPYKGFATIGYNLKRKFFYGTVSMPPAPTAASFPCLEGNLAFPDGPRRLKLYRVRSGPDPLVLGPIGAEAKAASGRLVWKAERASIAAGRYYVTFEERVRLSPNGPNECPGFRSAEVLLPQLTR